ncbi:MAG: rod shape-determining protein MreC [Candidatus Neomarinimicrobiota bacterium]
MRSFYFALIRNKDHVIFILALIAALFILFSNDSQEITDIRLKVNQLLEFTQIPSVWLQSKVSLQEENSLLREKNIQLKFLLDSMMNQEVENQQLRKMLDFRRKSTNRLLPANIHGKGITSNLSSFSIDVGLEDGVSVNDPVVIPEGVVGKTLIVGEHSSLVQLISDPNFFLSVRVVPDGSVGILSWLDNNRCEVREIPRSAVIKIGDLVYTSAHSDIYPENLPVGKVIAIYDERGSFQKRLTVELFYNVGTLQYAFVIIHEPDEQE